MSEEKKTVKESNFGIPLHEAQELVKNYLGTVPRGANGQPENTIAVWFGLPQLRYILANLELELHNSEGSDKVTDGIRIYFGNYGGNAPQGHKEYEYKNTLVLISTYEDKAKPGRHLDYFNYTIPMIPENRGALCPPDQGCDCCTDLIIPEDRPICKDECIPK